MNGAASIVRASVMVEGGGSVRQVIVSFLKNDDIARLCHKVVSCDLEQR